MSKCICFSTLNWLFSLGWKQRINFFAKGSVTFLWLGFFVFLPSITNCKIWLSSVLDKAATASWSWCFFVVSKASKIPLLLLLNVENRSSFDANKFKKCFLHDWSIHQWSLQQKHLTPRVCFPIKKISSLMIRIWFAKKESIAIIILSHNQVIFPLLFFSAPCN